MKFQVNGDNRGGSVTAQSGNESDPRQDSYNIDPGENAYAKIARTLAQTDGSGANAISATLQTSSEFVGYSRGECTGLTFSSKAVIGLPQDLSKRSMGVVQDQIQMNIRIPQPGKIRLTASVVADLDIVEIQFQGPQFPAPVKIYDTYDQTLDITKSGEYTLKGAYQLAVKLPNASLGGRELMAEMRATLTPA